MKAPTATIKTDGESMAMAYSALKSFKAAEKKPRDTNIKKLSRSPKKHIAKRAKRSPFNISSSFPEERSFDIKCVRARGIPPHAKVKNKEYTHIALW